MVTARPWAVPHAHEDGDNISRDRRGCALRTAQVREPAALAAACRVAGGFGYTSDDPLVLQETNNTVVWLQPSRQSRTTIGRVAFN